MKRKLEDLVHKIGVQPFMDENGESSVKDYLDTILYNFAHGWNPYEGFSNLSPSEKEFCVELEAIRNS